MLEPSTRFWNIFFEVFEQLPRQGPGDPESARTALELCHDLPKSAVTLDLGCGVGGQTLQLAQWISGPIVAIDNHPPHIAQLQAKLNVAGLASRIRAEVADMASLDFQESSFDLIWSEGALYNVGLARALSICHRLLRPGGYLAFTDAIWRKPDPPAAIKAGFDLDYPEMGTLNDALSTLRSSGLELIGHFTLPDSAWWDEFYRPMTERIQALTRQYAGDGEAQDILAQLAAEPDLHLRYSDYYAYEFFVARRPI